MPKDDLKYGDKPFVSQSNPHWAERQQLMVNPTVIPDEDAPPPPAYPLDLHHLSQQDMAKDEEAKKRWFLTAFVTPEDQHLLSPPEDPEPARQILNTIKQALAAPAGGCTPASLQALREQVIMLFQQEKWLGVALNMVDNKELPIDMLNTLIQWQALKIEFGEYFFTLDTVPVTQTLPTVHHTIFAKSELTLEEIRESAWGKIAEARKQRDWDNKWQPTLENFRSSIISREIDIIEDTQKLSFKTPSSLLLEHKQLTIVNGAPSYAIPLYSFGYLAFEDFCAAAFLGGRPLQAFLPTAKGNLYWAHHRYYGDTMIVRHDYLHIQNYPDVDQPTLQQKMKTLATVANALVRTGFVKDANQTVDLFTMSNVEGLLTECRNSKLGPREARDLFIQSLKILTAIYTEFGLAAGLDLTFSCSLDKKNRDLYHLETIHQGVPLTFSIEITSDKAHHQYLDEFNAAFHKIQALAKPPVQQEQQPKPKIQI